MIKKIQSKKGFTLIELLIVIVIIGVLATFLVSNYIGVSQRARDSRRKSDLKQIQAALELIRSDTGRYPYAIYSSPCPMSGPLQVGAVIYMNKVPCDPSLLTFYTSPAGNYGYVNRGGSYQLYACLENSNDTDPNYFPPLSIKTCPSFPSPLDHRFYDLNSP